MTVSLINFMNPPDNRENYGFHIRTYYDSEATNLIDSSLPDLLIPKLECDYPCRTCVNSDDPAQTTEERSMCTSCWVSETSPLKYFMPNLNEDTGERLDTGGICQEACDDGFTRNGKDNHVCERCEVQCLTCTEDDRNYCLICNEPTFPFKVENTGICLETCKDGYYESSATTCSFCEPPCASCEGTANTCLSCLPEPTPFLDKDTNTCLENCPVDFTPIKAVCEKCEPPCLHCEGTTQICTACDGSDGLLYLDGIICRQ